MKRAILALGLLLGNSAWAATLAPVTSDSAGNFTQKVRNDDANAVSQACILRAGGTPGVAADTLGCTIAGSAVLAAATVSISAQLPAGVNSQSIEARSMNLAPAGSSASSSWSNPSADNRVVNRPAAVPVPPFLVP